MRRAPHSLPVGAAIFSALLGLLAGESIGLADASRRPLVTGRETAIGQEATLGTYAGGGPIDVPDGMWYDATTGKLRSDALERDALLLSKRDDIGSDEAVARLRAQERMSVILPEAYRIHPGLVGVRWEDGRAVAQFKGPVPAGALELLRSAGTEIASEQVRYTASELDQLQTELGDSLRAMGIAEYAIALDPVDQRIIATVRATSEEPALRQRIAATLSTKLAAANVDIQVVYEPIAQATATYGGTESRIGTSRQCTNGFTVLGGSTPGVATDGHCPNAMTYLDWVTGITHTMTFADEHQGNWGDFQWHSTSGLEFDDFYSDELGAKRDVSGVRNVVGKGDELVWFGRGSNNNWLDWVEWPSVSTSGPARLACNHGYAVIPTDSGGPVYLGGTAIGFIYGWIFIDGARRDCFSQARYIDDALGVTIMQ